MTTTVKRGAGRPAATAKGNRHAQRTALPAKPEVIADAKDAIAQAAEEGSKIRAARAGARKRPKASAEASAANVREIEAKLITPPQYGLMKVAELREVAKSLGLQPPARAKKGDLLTAILKKEQADAAEAREAAKADASLSTPALEKKLDAAFGETDSKALKFGTAWAANVSKALDSKSGRKAEAFAVEAMRLGWAAEAQTREGGKHITVTAIRGDEKIVIEWIDGVFVDNCAYHCVGRSPIKVKNASAAKMRMAVPPAQAAAEAARVTAHKVTRGKAPRAVSDVPRASKLPFTEASLDQEVLDALYGKRITWNNKISGLPEEERVPALAEGTRLPDGSKGRAKQHYAPRIAEGPRGREIHFVGSNGFRTVLLSSITRVR